MNRSDDDLIMNQLDRLSATATPPSELEDSVVAELRARDLITSSSAIDSATLRRRSWQLALAASLVAALGGWFAHGLWNQRPFLPTRPQAEFLLLLSEPEELDIERAQQKLVTEYREWAQGLAAEKHLVAAGRLRSEGARLEGLEPPGEFDLDEAELRAATGYFVIRAADLSAATALAQTCPHLKYGGSIRVRPIASSVN